MASHWVPVTGLLSPLPWMLTLSAGNPLPIRKLATVLARASRQCLVVGIRADAVGVAHHHGVAILGFDVDDLLVEGVECLHPLRFELRLAKGKQHIRTQVEGLIHRLGSRGGGATTRGAATGTAATVRWGEYQLDGGGTDVADPAFGPLPTLSLSGSSPTRTM